MRNRVKQLYTEGRCAFGLQIKYPVAAVVDIAGVTGLDAVEIDPYHWNVRRETLEHMVRCAYSHDLTPWVRCRNDPWEIMITLDMGVQALSIAGCSSAEQAAAAVAAVYCPPRVARESNRPLRCQGMTDAAYHEWARSELMVCACVETVPGLANLRPIVETEGIDIVTTGRGELAHALGLQDERGHPTVVEAEKRVLNTALDAGKQIAFRCSTTEAGLDEAMYWAEHGARILLFEAEQSVLLQQYSGAVAGIRDAAPDQGAPRLLPGTQEVREG